MLIGVLESVNKCLLTQEQVYHMGIKPWIWSMKYTYIFYIHYMCILFIRKHEIILLDNLKFESSSC